MPRAVHRTPPLVSFLVGWLVGWLAPLVTITWCNKPNNHEFLRENNWRWGPPSLPIQWVSGALSLRVKRPGREADHSPPSSAEVTEWMDLYLHSPSMPLWRVPLPPERLILDVALTESQRYVTPILLSSWEIKAKVIRCCGRSYIGHPWHESVEHSVASQVLCPLNVFIQCLHWGRATMQQESEKKKDLCLDDSL
jgi:hypothetical protein